MRCLLTLLVGVMCVVSPLSAKIITHYGHGPAITDCLGDSAAQRQQIDRLTCKGLESLNGIDSLTRLDQLKLSRHETDQSLAAAPDIRSTSVRTLFLEGKGWARSDIEVLARTLPEVYNIWCRLCDIYELGLFSGFAKLTHLHLEMLPVIHSNWLGELTPDKEISFAGLPYDQMYSISVQASPVTHISCRSLGIWSKKARTYFNGRHTYPKPYKDSMACFPQLQLLRDLIPAGNALYHAGELQQAHDKYLQAFRINPYDQKAISSLALTYYKSGQLCKAAQVAASGTRLPNGIAATRAAIFYNLYLSLHAMGDFRQARAALQRSLDIQPTDYKKQQLAEPAGLNGQNTKCALTDNWIDDLYQALETNAVERSRGGPRPYADVDFNDFKVIQSVPGQQTIDYLTVSFTDIQFEPGLYGIVIRQKTGINPSTRFRQRQIDCDAEQKGRASPNSKEHVLYEQFQYLDNANHNPDEELELVKVFAIEKPEHNELCFFWGDAWWMESDEYKVELVRFNLLLK